MVHNLENIADEELFQIFCNDSELEEIAFAELYLRLSPRVYAYCRRFLGTKEDAQDVFQEAFMNFHQNAKGNDLTNVLGFLMKIARNLCINSLKRKKKTLVFDEYTMVKSENRDDKDELLNIIKMGIELLPDVHRDMFVLREYDGLSYIEIAEITGMNINTIRVKLFRAKQKLREILAPYLADISKYE